MEPLRRTTPLGHRWSSLTRDPVFFRETGVTDGARTRDSWSHNPALYLLSYGHRKRAEHSPRRVSRQRAEPLPKSPPIVEATLPTSAAVSKTTPSSRLYLSEPVVKFSEPT